MTRKIFIALIFISSAGLILSAALEDAWLALACYAILMPSLAYIDIHNQ